MWVMSLPSSPRFSGAFGKRRKPDVVWDFGSLISKSESFKHHQKCFPSCRCCYCAEAEGHDETEGITKGSFWCLASGWIANAITWSLTSLILCLQHIQSLVRALHVAHLVNKHNFIVLLLYIFHTLLWTWTVNSGLVATSLKKLQPWARQENSAFTRSDREVFHLITRHHFFFRFCEFVLLPLFNWRSERFLHNQIVLLLTPGVCVASTAPIGQLEMKMKMPAVLDVKNISAAKTLNTAWCKTGLWCQQLHHLLRQPPKMLTFSPF